MSLRLQQWLFLTACLSLSLSAPAEGQSFVEGYWDDRFGDAADGGFGLNGHLNAVAVHPVTGDVYVGGHTVQRDNRTRYVARWDGQAWHTFGGPGFDVNVMAFDANGNLYVGGRFSEVYQPDDTALDAANVAMWDGERWHGLGLGLDGRVTAMAVDPNNGDVYFGGDWNGGFDRGLASDSSETYSPKVIRWDGAQWQPVGKGASAGFGQGVFAMAVDPASGDLYLGSGLLSRVFNPDSSEVPVDNVARWDGAEWSAMPGPVTGDIRALAFHDGLLYAGGNFRGIGAAAGSGLAWWNGSEWTTPGEGVSSRTHDVWAVAVDGDDVYVGGRFAEVIDPQGRAKAVRNIAVWRADSETWATLGAGIEDPSNTMVHAFAIRGDDVYIGGRFREAGGQWAYYFSRWISRGPPYPAAYVTFRVDMRRPMRTLMNNVSRPMAVVYDEDAAGSYLLYDTNEDSIWSVRVPQPIGDRVEYAFGLDYRWNRDGTTDLIYERDGSDGARSLTLSSTVPVVLPAVLFDDQPLRAVGANAQANRVDVFLAGNPDPYDFRVGTNDTYTTIDFETLDRTAVGAARWYADDPGGSAPSGIAVVASNTYWDIEISPAQAEFTARVSFDYAQLTGIGQPADLRLLYRSDTSEPWQSVETEQDHTAQTLSAAARTLLTGHWTVGSVSHANPLTSDPPAVVSVPSPPDGSLNVPETPLLAWNGARHASRYDLYLWPAAEPEPMTPTSDGLQEPSFNVKAVLDQNVEYKWRVVSKNINGETEGPVWSFRVGAAPDLVVRDLQVPTEAVSGGEIGLSWTVANEGNNGTRAPAWDEAVFLSEDAVLDSDDLLLGRVPNASHLGPGDSYRQTASFEIPLRVRSTNEERIVEGNFYVLVKTDEQSREIESDEENNETPSSAYISIRLPTLPDAITDGSLRAIPYCPVIICASGLGCSIIRYDPCTSLAEEDLSRMTVPFTTGPFGVQYAFAWDGVNQGVGPLSSTEDVLFFSEDSTLSATSAISLGSATSFNIAPGESFEATTIPGVSFGGPVPPGAGLINLLSQAILNEVAIPDSGFFFVVSDAQNNAYEGAGEDNNIWRNPTKTVFRPVPPSDIEAIALDTPASAQSSDSISVTWTVRNNGPSEVIASWWRYEIYLSSDQEIDPEQDRLLGHFPHPNSFGHRLQPDEDSTLTKKVRLPDGVEGTYYLIAQFDPNGNINERINEEVFLDNNVIVGEAIGIGLADYPDLQISDVQTPDAASAGTSMLVSYEATNAGAGDIESDWVDGMYLSRSPTWTGESRRFFRERIEDLLNAGQAYQRDTALRLPEGLSAGTYYLYVVADADSGIYEHGEAETNNVRRSGAITVGPAALADLVVENLDMPESATSGSDVTVSWNVRNQGTAKTSATSWTDALYISTDPQLDAADVVIGKVLHTGALAPGDVYDASLTAVLPEDFSGARYLIVRNDENGSVSDAVPTNNTVSSDQSVEVALGLTADLRIASVDVSGTPTAGQPLTVSVTTMNDGAAISAEKLWSDVWSLAPSSGRSAERVTLASEQVSGPLDAGASYTHEIEVMLPVYAAGNYFLTTETNAQHSVGEGGRRENNVDNQIITAVLPPPVDLVVENIQVPAAAGPGETINITYDIVNKGDNAADGVLFDGVFLSEDESFDVEDARLGVRRREVALAPGSSMKMRLAVQVPRLGVASALEMDEQRSSAPQRTSNTSEQETAASPLADLEDDVPALLPGTYSAVVWTDLRNNIRESDNTNNHSTSAEQISIDVQELALDTPETATATADKRLYYKVVASEGKDLRLTLESLTMDRRAEEFEVYVAFERAPTPSEFDHAFLAESVAEMPRVLVPQTKAGTYYVMVRNPRLVNTDGGADFSLLAEAFDFALLDITPDAGGRGGRVVATVSGAQFGETTEFYLESDAARIDGTLLKILSPMQAEVRFDLSGSPLGSYDVVAEQADGSLARLAESFTVEPRTAGGLRYAFSTPPALFARGPASFEITVTNEDNVDHDVVILTVLVPGDHTFSIESDGFKSAFMLPNEVGISQEVMPAGGLPLGAVLEDGSAANLGVITMVAKNVRVGETLTARLRTPFIHGPIGSELVLGARAKGYSENSLVELIRRKAQEVARVMREAVARDMAGTFGDAAVKAQYLDALDEMLAMSKDEMVSAYRRTGLFGDGPLTSIHSEPAFIGETEKNLKAGGVGEFTAFDTTPYSVVSMAGDALCSNLATAAGFVLTVGGMVSAAGILVGVTIGAIVATPAFVLGAALTVVGGVIFTAITLDSVINDRDWGLTGTLGGVPTSPSPSGVANAFATPLINILCSAISGAHDPNDIIGPAGVGEARWVRRDEVLRYKIRFENDPEVANAPARTVILRQRLDDDLDLRTVRLEGFGFGPFDFEVPGSRAYYETRLDVRDSLGVFVDVDAGLDIGARELFFRFRSIDPRSGEPSVDPLRGFLPPNDTPPEGDGYVSYRVVSRPDAATADRIDARAEIFFDNNPAISTPAIFNTIDADLPRSSISQADVVELDSSSVSLQWSAADPDPGSGVSRYALYVAEEGGEFSPMLEGLVDTTHVFEGEPGTRYGFFVVAEDRAGNLEPLKNRAEANVAVGVETTHGPEIPERFVLRQNYPNPFNPATTIAFDLPRYAEVRITVYDLLGRRVLLLRDEEMSPGRYEQRIDMNSFASGVYFYEVLARGSGGVRFHDVKKFVLVK